MVVKKEKKVETTLGDLIVALTDEAVLLLEDEKEAHPLVAHILPGLFHVPDSVFPRWH